MSLTLSMISSTLATFPMPFGSPYGALPANRPAPPPMFRPISRSGPPSMQRREPVPLVFPGSLSRGKFRDQFRAATAGLPMRTMMLQLRGSPSRGVAQYTKAPPAFKFLKPNPLPSPQPTIVVNPLKYESMQITPIKYEALKISHSQNNVKPKPTPEYNYEKPNVHTTKLQLRLPSDVAAGAIRTIPAPNLSVQDNKIQFFSDNKEPPKNPFKRPNLIPQYEVEEQSNDVTFKDPYTGKNTLWAPDPDPQYQNVKLKPSTDPLSRPSNYQTLPNDLAAQIAQVQQPQYIASPAQARPVMAAAPVAYVQSQSPYDYQTYAYAYMPMQASATTNAGIYQPSMLQGMAPYNPSYLIAQSSQLFNQHQQNLYNKQQQEPSYVQEFAQNSLNYDPYANAAKLQQQQQQQSYNAYDVASAQLQQIQALQAATQLQYQDQSQQALQQQPQYTQQYQNDASVNPQAYTQLIEAQHYNPYATSTQPPLTAKDLASIFKYGTLSQSSEESSEQPGNYQNDYYNYDKYSQQQQAQPQPQQSHFQPTHATQAPEILQGQETLTPQSAFEQHQQALAAQLSKAGQQDQYQSHGSHNPLRIYVPDEAQSKSDENVDGDETPTELTGTQQTQQDEPKERLDTIIDNNYYDGMEYQYNDDYQPVDDDTKPNANLTNHQLESKE
uniref:CSON006444 protein n=1 Tax=Culicoides sonorensis TaxID=179676 RepID=A0A336LB54_CULSO